MAYAGIFSGFSGSAAKSRVLMKVFESMGYLSPVGVAQELRSLPTAVQENPCSPDVVMQSQDRVSQNVEHADVMEKRYQTILAAIDEKINQRKKSWLKNIGILLISLLVFFQLGFFSWGLESVLMIILVLFVHEMGHFLG
jgi:hypothetical protein